MARRVGAHRRAADEVGEELRRDGVGKVDGGGHAEPVEVEEQLARRLQPAVDAERAVAVRIARDRAGLHDDEHVVAERRELEQPAAEAVHRHRVGRALLGLDEQQQAVVRALHHCQDLFACLDAEVVDLAVARELLEGARRRKKGGEAGDAHVVGLGRGVGHRAGGGGRRRVVLHGDRGRRGRGERDRARRGSITTRRARRCAGCVGDGPRVARPGLRRASGDDKSAR